MLKQNRSFLKKLLKVLIGLIEVIYKDLCYADEGVVAQLCNPSTLQPEQSGRQDSIPGRVPPFERHDKGSQTRLVLSYFCDLALIASNRNFTFAFI